jgi:hypothetical protein
MKDENLRSLFNEYRKCIRGLILPDLDKDDIDLNYFKKCTQQINDIDKYYTPHGNKAHDIHYTLDHDLDAQVDKDIHKLHPYGWSEKRVRNL